MSQTRHDAHGIPTHPGGGWAHHMGDARAHMSDTRTHPGDSRTRSVDARPQPFLTASSFTPATPAPGSRRALCLWLPTYELRLEIMRAPELGSTSVALLSPGQSVRRTVWQVSERAWDAGVRPDQLVSQAISLCPSLTLLEPDPAHYDAATDALLEVLSELTPVLEPSGQGRIFLGMDGLERLYGPPARQAERALGSLFRVFPAPLVAATRAGMAPGKFGAWVAAASASPGEPLILSEDELPRFLASRPVASLPVDPLMIQRLERLGVATLGDLGRFPEPSLLAQFGEEGRSALAWSTGRRIDPVHPWHRPRPIRVSLDFPTPVGLAETLHGALDRLVERALSRPARRGRSVAAARLGAHLEGGGSWFVEAILREPTSERDRISFPLRSKMALSPPPKAVETLLLEFTRFGAPSAQTSLFNRKDEAGRGQGGRDLSRGEVPVPLKDAVRDLKLRLGFSPLYRVVEVDPWSRLPERRHALLSFDP
jgi:nucleotidyltransferase/DNA polymerase involved in DNA repair